MATPAEINDLVVVRLNLSYLPFQPKITAGQPNPRYPAYLAEYMKALQWYEPDILEKAMDDVLEAWRGKEWPKPAFIVEHCQARYRNRPRPPQKYLPLPDKRPVGAEREAIRAKLRATVEAMQSGDWGRDEDLDYRRVYGGEDG